MIILIMDKEQFAAEIRAGIPDVLPEPMPYDTEINHAPKRKDILTPAEKKLALRNALRYFPKKFHAVLAPEFADELETYGYTCTASARSTRCMPVRLTSTLTARSRPQR